MNDLRLCCDRCGTEVLTCAAGALKVRTKVLRRDPDGAVRAVCRTCGADVPMPLQVEMAAPMPRLYVRPSGRP